MARCYWHLKQDCTRGSKYWSIASVRLY